MMKPFFLFALAASVPALALPGCASATHATQQERQSLMEQGTDMIAESEEWMASFEEMAVQFGRPLPQLEPDSAFNRHIAALRRYRSDLREPGADLDALAAREEALVRSHERLQDAYRNMVRLAREGKLRPGPEFAEDTPR
jgi:hypothetical protein